MRLAPGAAQALAGSGRVAAGGGDGAPTGRGCPGRTTPPLPPSRTARVRRPAHARTAHSVGVCGPPATRTPNLWIVGVRVRSGLVRGHDGRPAPVRFGSIARAAVLLRCTALRPAYSKVALTSLCQYAGYDRWPQPSDYDSLRPDASPVSEETTLHDRHATTRAVYADGSIVITSVSKPTPESSGEGDVSPLSVEACSVRNSPPYAVYYDSCRADVNYGIIRMGFYFNYQQITSLGAKITSYWGRFQHCFGCTLSDHRLERWSDTQVRYSAECNIAFKGFPAGWTAWMQANVSMTNAWTTNN